MGARPSPPSTARSRHPRSLTAPDRGACGSDACRRAAAARAHTQQGHRAAARVAKRPAGSTQRCTWPVPTAHTTDQQRRRLRACSCKALWHQHAPLRDQRRRKSVGMRRREGRAGGVVGIRAVHTTTSTQGQSVRSRVVAGGEARAALVLSGGRREATTSPQQHNFDRTANRPRNRGRLAAPRRDGSSALAGRHFLP